MKWKQEWEQIKPERERGEEGVELAGERRRGDEMRWGYVTAKRAGQIWKGMGDKTLTEQKKKSSTVSSTTHLEETERHNKSCKRSKEIKHYQTKKTNEGLEMKWDLTDLPVKFSGGAVFEKFIFFIFFLLFLFFFYYIYFFFINLRFWQAGRV